MQTDFPLISKEARAMEKIRIDALWRSPYATLAAPLLSRFLYPWEILSEISAFILKCGEMLSEEAYEKRGEGVWVSRKATVASGVTIIGPCIICEGAEIRHCAYLRGSVIVGKDAVVGNSTELKNCILFDGVQVPHYNYVGDSILGYRAHMGAGAITSNVKSDKSEVTVRLGDARIPTGRKKFGAMLGDCVEVGCNTVLNPGTVIGARSNIYPLSSVRGFVPEDCIFKSQSNIVKKN